MTDDLEVIGKCLKCEGDILCFGWGTNEHATVEICAGYGSRYDTSEFTGFICDDCLERLIETELVPKFRDYMVDWPHGPLSPKKWLPVSEYKRLVAEAQERLKEGGGGFQ